MSDVREKKQDPSPNVKVLMSGFETGTVQNGAPKYTGEKPIARPGGARKLAKEFEKKSEPSPAPEITRKTPKTTTSPQSPTPATSDEKPPMSTEPTPTETSSPPATQAPPKASPVPAKTSATGKPQNVLVVYADMERTGFNGQVLDDTVSKLKAQGHAVDVSDLYRSQFSPLPTRQDAGVAENGGNFLYEESMLSANLNNKVAADIQAEQEKVRKANLVIFIFRILPSGVPTMLQGYLNRVLSEGFGADFTSKEMFDKGKLAGKKAVLCMSCLLNADNFNKTSVFGELEGYLLPVQYGSLRYCGFDVLAPHMNDDYFYGGDAQQKARLDAWSKRLDNILGEKAITFAQNPSVHG